MTLITSEIVRALIQELGLPPVVLALQEGRGPPSVRYHYGPPRAYLRLPAAIQARYASDKVVPLLDDGDSYALLGYHREKRGFVRFCMESSKEEVLSAEVLSWQALMAGEFLDLWESGSLSVDTSDVEDYSPERVREIARGRELDELRRLAAQFDYRFLDEMLERLPEKGFARSEDRDAWLRAFVQWIDHDAT